MTKTQVNKLIRAKCMDCTCDQLSEIWHCTVQTCPLRPHRMGYGKDADQIVASFTKGSSPAEYPTEYPCESIPE